MHGYWAAGRGSRPAGPVFGPFDASAGRVCRAIDAPAGPVLYVKYSQTIGASTSSGNKQLHQLGARIASAGPLPVDRGPRIAGHLARIAGRWAVRLGQCARAAGGLDLREIVQAKENPPAIAGGRALFWCWAGRYWAGRRAIIVPIGNPCQSVKYVRVMSEYSFL